jgi:hypothetical protein
MTPVFACRGVRRVGWWSSWFVLVAAAIFHPIRKFDFVNFDDDLYVYTNPWLKQGFTAKSVEWALTAQLTHFSQRAEYWSPITLFTRLFDGEFFGINAGAHHVTSAVLHTLNAILLFLAMRALTGAPIRSAFVRDAFPRASAEYRTRSAGLSARKGSW